MSEHVLVTEAAFSRILDSDVTIILQ